MGGESWNRQFLQMADPGEREKVENSLAKINFFLNTIYGLKQRILLGEINDPVMGVDIKGNCQCGKTPRRYKTFNM